MNVIALNQYLATTKASIPKNLIITKANNHELTVKNITLSQTLSSSNTEKVVIKFDKPLLAQIFRNSSNI